MKYLALLFVPIFLLFAGWQYNDPDPVLWIPIYLIAAYAAFQAFRGQSNPEMLVVLFIMSFAGGLNSWQQMTAWEGFVTDGLSMKTVNQELAREAWGLWICSGAYLLFWFMKTKK
ncbi:Transmembrane family 220, helix [Pseudarcicella hirudinis]|uniref:Transmembrane family 220, helix n=1 Tax=Pseudarcicella hirudinis TaxID=1079859 RepID=A0A1I5PEP4_9BACT|nr:transmembrane 220 family protein [Pseudarcicella hirudinis]SFP32001.1 Transmembrane family 220, helix [Pseudarcicella hirudinis]